MQALTTAVWLCAQERRLLEGAKARKEAKDWAGACAMYEQFLRYAPDNHDAQLEVRLLTQLINHQQAQQKHEARQRRFEEKLSEPPAMGSLPVGLGSPIIDDIPHVQRGSGGMPLSQTMYRRQLAEQAQEMKQRKDKERAEEAAMDARINQVARIEEALARQQHEAAQLKGNVVDKNARAAEIEARRQAKMDAWRKVGATRMGGRRDGEGRS